MNTPTLIQRVLGANSKVRLFVLLLVASYLVLRCPGIVAGFPADLQQAIFALANESWHIAIAAALWFVKQSNVSGNGTPDDPHRVAASDGGVTHLSLILFCFLAGAMLFAGCVTDAITGKKRLATAAEISADVAKFQANPTVQAVEKDAEVFIGNTLLSVAQEEVNGGKFDQAWTIATALNSTAAVVRNMPPSQAGNVIVSTVQNFTGDPSTKPIAQKLAAAYVNANPQTPAQQSATVAALATGVQKGATNAAQAQP